MSLELTMYNTIALLHFFLSCVFFSCYQTNRRKE